MKKYLMTGIAALALCAGFTSCSHDLDVPSPEKMKEMEAQKIVNNYEKAFKAYVGGNIAANQTWGFGTLASARTRAEGDHVGDGNTEHNQWGACDNIYKLDVPPALTEGQKLRVQKYFQTHPYLTYKDPELTDFFVQQVYKGNPTTAGSLSPEQYSTGDGKTVKSSDHMDWLTVGNGNKHVNDFNFGTYDHGNTTTVINTGVKQNDYDIPGNTHQDQITLMQNASTECVGFSVSNGTIHHNDCCALAKAKVIDDWALDETNWVNGKPIGENVWYDGRDENGNVIDNQKWNRSFVGLDYEQKTLEDCYGIGYNNYGQPYSPVYAKVGDGPQKNYVWDGTRFWTWNDIKDEFFYLVDDQGNFILDENGQKQKVVYVNSDTNEICAENADYSQQGDLLRKFTKEEFAAKGVTINNADEEVFDLTKVYAKLKQNCMPAINGNLTKYIKNIGGRDYVYSDWIVTLTPALPQGDTSDPTKWSIRVMAEDLSASDDTDFDFNDVVLDFECEEGSSTLNVTLQAAGGTLPLRINQNDNWEVHKLFGLNVTNIMINTNWNRSNGTEIAEKPTFDITTSSTINSEDAFLAAVKAVKLEVYKTSEGVEQWIEMRADQGKPAAKFAVPTTVKWMDERISIKTKYGKFSTWATSAPDVQWWDPSKSGDE